MDYFQILQQITYSLIVGIRVTYFETPIIFWLQTHQSMVYSDLELSYF